MGLGLAHGAGVAKLGGAVTVAGGPAPLAAVANAN